MKKILILCLFAVSVSALAEDGKTIMNHHLRTGDSYQGLDEAGNPCRVLLLTNTTREVMEVVFTDAVFVPKQSFYISSKKNYPVKHGDGLTSYTYEVRGANSDFGKTAYSSGESIFYLEMHNSEEEWTCKIIK